MCLVIFAHQLSPEYPLVVAANRDEYYARATASATFWPDAPALLAGRDLEQGGTWMGVSRSGRFAAITNFRDPNAGVAAPRSRGELPTGFLTGQMSARHYLDELALRASQYAGFNLLLGDGEQQMWYYSNSPNSPTRAGPVQLPPGIYGLSNANLDTPWPKVVCGKTQLTKALSTGPLSHDKLAATVQNRQLADRASLAVDGIDTDMAHLLSAQFIVAESYGTRSSTTLWRDRQGRTSWREQSFNERGEVCNSVEHNFILSPD